MDKASTRVLRSRRSITVLIVLFTILAISIFPGLSNQESNTQQSNVLADIDTSSELAREALETLQVKGRAAKTGYTRDEFGSGWASLDGCDLRNLMLQEQLQAIELADDGCIVLQGSLQDPYTGETIQFLRGRTTSDAVQVDHVVALSDAWQKGAQGLDFSERVVFANDPLNLLAVDGPTNQEKGDSDAASWLPPNRSFRCRYVARQIAVKAKYRLWVTEAEKAAMNRVLNSCKDQRLPVET